MKSKLLLVVLLFFAVGAVASPHTVTYYQTYGGWLNATSPANWYPPNVLPPCAPWCHFPYQSAPINQSQNPYSAVVTDVGSFGAPRGVFAGVYDQVWTDRVTVEANEFTTWSVPGVPLFAFGGYWDFSPDGYGQGLALTINGTFGSMHVADICGDVVNGCGLGPDVFVVPDGSWFGIVTDFAFNSFTITADHVPGVAETYDLAGLDMASVPEPGTLILLGTGILGLAGTLRRRFF